MASELTIKIVIADDHEIFRGGLKMVLNKLPYLEVIGEASNGLELLSILKDLKPNIVMVDIEMPIMNGVDAARKAIELYPDLKVIALTMFNDEDYIQSMLDAGVKGFLIKNINKDTLDKAIQMVNMGGTYYSEELFDYFTKKISSKTIKEEPGIDFTKREKEILALLVEGISNKEIADRLFVSERTIVGHKTNLLAKTGCKNTVSLLAFAVKNKLVDFGS